MKKWIKENWIVIFLAGIILASFSAGVRGCVDERNYKKEIKGLNQDITFLKQDLKKEAGKTKAALNEARVAEEASAKYREEREAAKARVAAVEREKVGLEERIAALPPIRVVVRVVELLRVEPEDLTLRPDGVLFTLVATRRCLEELEGFSLVKKQYGDMQFALAKSEASELELLVAIEKKDIAIASQKEQIDKWPKIEERWQEKLDLSEGRRKRARAKGRKQGAVVVAIISVVLFVLEK